MNRFALVVFAGLVALVVQADDKPRAAVPGYFTTVPATESVALDPKIRADLDAAKTPAFADLTPAEARAAFDKRTAAVPRLDEPVARVEDRTIAGPGGKLPLRVYTPKGQGPFPILLYFHGGGWVLGNLDTVDDLCRSLCARAGALVVSVDYRLAPEHKFPAAQEDCYAVLKWCNEHAGEIGGDGKRLAVAGDSAGGNLAAATALATRDKNGPAVALQVLIYPALNTNLDTASYHECATGFGLSRAAMAYFWKSYLPKPEDGANPYAAPLVAKELKGVAPALILTANYDVLRDDGEAYAARLKQAGVPVKCTRYLSMNHGFIRYGSIHEPAKRGLQEIADGLKKAFER